MLYKVTQADDRPSVDISLSASGLILGTSTEIQRWDKEDIQILKDLCDVLEEYGVLLGKHLEGLNFGVIAILWDTYDHWEILDSILERLKRGGINAVWLTDQQSPL